MKGAGSAALETEALYLSTDQTQHGQRQWQHILFPYCLNPVPQLRLGGATFKGERGPSVAVLARPPGPAQPSP